MNRVNFAFIGCGRISGRHAEALQNSNLAKLVAVCDLNAERARERSHQNHVPYYQNYHDMMVKHPEIDVVTVMTPSGSHFEHACDLVTRYKKHILIEKPMVMTPRQGVELRQVAKAAGVRIFPVFQNRYNKAVQKVKSEVAEGGKLGSIRIGTVRMRWCRPQRYYDLSDWRGTWAMDGGALTNQGVHYIDLLRFICGDIEKVSSIKATLGVNIEVEDTLVATLQFKNGALGLIEVTTAARPDDFEASISCVCEKGLAVISGIATNELQTFSPDPNACETFSENFPTVYGYGHNEIIDRVALAVRDLGAAPVDYDDGLETIRFLHALYLSSETGQWVKLDGEAVSAFLGRPDDELLSLYRTPPPKVTNQDCSAMSMTQ